MMTLQLSNELAEEISNEAETRGLVIEEFLRLLLRRERTLADRQKVEQEQNWWLSRPLSERAKFEGQYIAVHNKKLIDHDVDRLSLRRRIRATYGQTAILIMPAEGVPEINVYSSRFVQRNVNHEIAL